MSVNVDNNELEKFSSRAHAWWDVEGEFRTLHAINPTRLHYVEQCCSLAHRDVLDIGCGGGILSEAMAEKHARVTAIDASEENIDCARRHADSKGHAINYMCTTAEDFALEHARQFDVITCMELLEHVPDPLSLIEACATLVKPGGHVIFSTLNRQPGAYLLAVLAGEYLLNLLPRGTHDYKKFIKPAELARWCRQHGLQMQSVAGIHYNPLLKRCALDKKPSVNYLLNTVAS